MWAYNFGITRKDFLDAGMFNPAISCCSIQGIELGYRLEQKHVKGFFSTAARVYDCIPLSLESEYQICYQEGYDIFQVIKQVDDPALWNRYARLFSWWARTLSALLGFLFRGKTLEIMEQIIPPSFLRWLISHIGTTNGYHDAARGRAPRITTRHFQEIK